MKKSFIAAVELAKRLTDKDDYICLITEPYGNKNRVGAVPSGAKTISYGKSQTRAAIMFSSEVGLLHIESLCNEDCAVGLLKLDGVLTLIVSTYLDIKKDVVPTWLDDIVEYAKKRGYALLIGMDSNAHSVLFGPESNSRGEQLEEFIIDNGLAVENIGNTPTFQATRQSCEIATHIDVTLSKGLGSLIKNWEVNTNFNGSDHNTIEFLN